MKMFIIAFAFIALTAADVSHLNLNREYLPPDNQQHHHHHGGSVASSASVSSSQYGAVNIQGRIGDDVQQQSQDIPDSYAPLSNDISVDVPAAQEQDVPAGGIGADTYTPAHLAQSEQSIPGGNSDSYTPAHLPQPEQSIPGGNSNSYTPAHLPQPEQNIPGDNSNSYTPAHLIEQEQPVPAAIGADTYTPAHLQPAAQEQYAPAQAQVQEQYAPAQAQEQYAPAQTQEQPQSTQLRFGGEVEQNAPAGNAASGIDTQYGTNGGYVY